MKEGMHMPRDDRVFINGKRVADEAIYLKEARYEEPKECFKLFGKLILEADYPPGSALLDVGCATGELLYYLKKALPNFGSFYGMDISERLLERARKRVAGVEFFLGSILDQRPFKRRLYDVVTCSGVISIFDDFERPLKNLLACVRKGGMVLIFAGFNDDPIDVIVRYRYADRPSHNWESGWNIFSCRTVEDLLIKTGHKIKWTWHPFRLPFALKKRPKDPMRSWTIATEDCPHQLANGACQILNFKFLKIYMMGPTVSNTP